MCTGKIILDKNKVLLKNFNEYFTTLENCFSLTARKRFYTSYNFNFWLLSSLGYTLKLNTILFFSVEIVPVMKDSVVCLSKKVSQQLGGISPLCIVYRVTNSIKLIDPSTAQRKCLYFSILWRYATML